MPIQFCSPCGNTLPVSMSPRIACDCCGVINENTLLNTTTKSSSSDFPSELRRQRGTVAKEKLASGTETWATINESCSKCGADEVKYTALQLRSADEGSTLFYSCPKCSEKWKQDN